MEEPRDQLSCENFHFILQPNVDFAVFDRLNTAIIGVTMIMGKGPATILYEGDTPIKLGARIYRNDGTQEKPKFGAQVAEFRAESEKITLRKGGSHQFHIVVTLPEVIDDNLVLEISLVKESHFWLSDLGHSTLILPLVRRHMVAPFEKDDPYHIADALVSLEEYRRREARYEAIIFALLKQLPKDSRPKKGQDS